MPSKEPKRHQREVSYTYERPKLDRQGRGKKADMWTRTRASRFKAPLIAKPTLIYDGAPRHAVFEQRAREEASRAARVAASFVQR